MQFKFNLNIQLLVMLIGLRKEKLLESKIKDNAVHAGHFQLLLLLRALFFLLVNQKPFILNNN
jgi:hypothetical protein